MQKNQLSPFHSELLNYLHEDVQHRLKVEDFGSRSNLEFQAFLKGLSPNSLDECLPIDEIVAGYQNFIGAPPINQIEKVLMEAFPVKDFIDLGLSRYYPKIYRGLPRLYHKESPTRSQIKKSFTHLPSLKKQAASKALFSLYGKVPVTGKVTIFTWVLLDGMGDYTAALEIMRLLKGKMPYLDLHFVALVNRALLPILPEIENSLLLPYDPESAPGVITNEAYALLRSSDLILQTPTYYPATNELLEKLKTTPSEKPIPKMEFLGEYGFLESRWFHPQSSGYSMGLHFLEKGILTRKKVQASFQDIQNEKLKTWVNPENHFYLAYLTSATGGAIYLHALLKSLENDPKTIDICTPNLGWFFAHLENQKANERPCLEWDVNVASIDLYFQDRIHSIFVAPTGKKVRIFAPGMISQSDFRVLLALSGDWVAVRGNQSFSEAICQDKVFFYDGREHSRFFMKDLLAIAENRISSCQSALSCIRGMVKGFLYNVPVQEGEWVDETYFQPIEDWTSIAMEIGLALTDPDTIQGYQSLNRVLAEEFSSNLFICHLVQRALCHHHYPIIEKIENEELALFTSGAQSFSDLIKAQREVVKSMIQ